MNIIQNKNISVQTKLTENITHHTIHLQFNRQIVGGVVKENKIKVLGKINKTLILSHFGQVKAYKPPKPTWYKN